MRIAGVCLPVLLNLVFVFTSCSDDKDESLKILDPSGVNTLTEVNVSVGESWIRVSGGDGEYSVVSGNKEIADVSVDKDVMEVRAYRLGDTEITLADRAGEQIKLPLHVEAKKRALEVKRVAVYVETEDADVKEMLEEELRAKFPVSEGGRYGLMQEKWSSTRYEGKLVVYPGTSNDESYPGTFVWDRNVKPERLTFEYNGVTHVYELPVKGLPEGGESEAGKMIHGDELFEGKSVTRDLGPVQAWMGEDFTEQYRRDYPNVTRVISLEYVSFSR